MDRQVQVTSILISAKTRIILPADLLDHIRGIFEKDQSLERIYVTDLKKSYTPSTDVDTRDIEGIVAHYGRDYIYRVDAFELDADNPRKKLVNKLIENPNALAEALSDETRIPASETGLFANAYDEANEKLRQLANPPTVPETLPEETKYAISRILWMAEQYAKHSSNERALLNRCKTQLISHLHQEK